MLFWLCAAEPVDEVGDDWTPDTGIEPIGVAIAVVVIFSVATPVPLTSSVEEIGEKVTGKVPVIVEVAIFEGIIEIGVFDGLAVIPGVVPRLSVLVAGIGVSAGVFVAGVNVGIDWKSAFAHCY